MMRCVQKKKKILGPNLLMYLSSDTIPIVHMPVRTSESISDLFLSSLCCRYMQEENLVQRKGQENLHCITLPSYSRSSSPRAYSTDEASYITQRPIVRSPRSRVIPGESVMPDGQLLRDRSFRGPFRGLSVFPA